MSLNVYYDDDIRARLASLDIANRNVVGMAASSDRLNDYCRGWQDALAAVAIAFDVMPAAKEEPR